MPVQCSPLSNAVIARREKLFQEVLTDDLAVGGGLTNVESNIKKLLGQWVWDETGVQY